jgi:hypothetical protein
MEGGLLYTPGYVARLTAQLRGAMRAALTPTSREGLVGNALVADTPAGAELTGSIIQDLVKKGAVGFSEMMAATSSNAFVRSFIFQLASYDVSSDICQALGRGGGHVSRRRVASQHIQPCADCRGRGCLRARGACHRGRREALGSRQTRQVLQGP